VEGPQADIAPADRGLQPRAERRLARAADRLRFGPAPRRALAARGRLRRPPRQTSGVEQACLDRVHSLKELRASAQARDSGQASR